MMAFGLNSVLGDVIAEPTEGSFAEFFTAKERVAVALAAKHQVRMTSHLTHASNSGESMVKFAKVQSRGMYAQTKDIGIIWSNMRYKDIGKAWLTHC